MENPGQSGRSDANRVVVAAGGIVVCANDPDDAPRVALIHRPRHGGDWSLPKGHVDPGETWRDAAVREVLEETGAHATVTGEFIPVCYRIGERVKLVVYFPMRTQSRGEFEQTDEVDEMRWATPAEAHTLLTYPTDRDVLDALLHTARAEDRAP